MRFLFFLILIIPALSGFTQARPFTHGLDKRRYTVYLPAAYHQQKQAAFPVIFNFHGGGMTMTEQMFYTGMNEAAEKYHFIVVYPQGIRQDWNVGFEMAYQKGTDDVGFIRSLLGHLEKTYRIDSSMIFATGLSRGGFFCHRLAAELPEKFAAVASVGGPLPDSVAYFHKGKMPVSVMVVHGDADLVVNHEGKEGAYKSNKSTYQYWRTFNGLSHVVERRDSIDLLPGDSTSIQVWETIGSGVSVRAVTIRNGGHTWPGRHPFNIGFDLGKTSQELDMNQLLWSFFRNNKKLIR